MPSQPLFVNALGAPRDYLVDGRYTKSLNWHHGFRRRLTEGKR